jgi:chromosome segregation ATPase
MDRILKIMLAGAGLALFSPCAVRAADTSDSDEGRLREVLRSTMLQLRDAQTDLANLQSAQAGQADDKKALQEQLALLKKHGEEDRAAAQREIDSSKAKLDQQGEEIARLQEALAQWKAAAEKANAEARSAEAQCAKQSTGAIVLERRVEDLEAKNAALERIGNEILTRYEKFSLGEQFLAKEPFIGRTRVEIENLVQDYDDKLLDQRANP